MRKYYVLIKSFSEHYCSEKRYLIALADGEQIAGVYRGHRPVVVVAPRGSYHYTCGDMPRYYPAKFGGKVLSVFKWQRTGVCQYAADEAPGEKGVLWRQDSRASDVLIARTDKVLDLSDAQPFDSDWQWSVAPVEDLDPALTAREADLAVAFPQFQE